MNRYWSNILNEIDPYVPGEQPQDKKYIKLNTNENPYPPSPRVMEAVKKSANEDLRLYPDPDCCVLRSAIAEYYNQEKDNIFVGNGSDEILALAFYAFFKQDKPILFPDISYSFYEPYSLFFNINIEKIQVTQALEIRLDDYMKPNGGIIFANPNAPTGRYIPLKDIESLINSNKDSVVVVDEAYVDFGGESAIPLTEKYPNLLVVHTLSKSRALAGMRIGYAIGNKGLIDGMDRAKNSFNSYTLDRLALVAGVEAFKDSDYFEQTRTRIIATREWVTKELTDAGFSVIPSMTNFIFIEHKKVPAKRIFQELRKQGILIRYFEKSRIDNFLRVTIGTDEDMNTFIEKLRGVLFGSSGK